ncbi:MAG: sodium:solute symporter family protein [Victivallaceae bacterium]
MHIVDWLIMTLPLLICAVIALYSRRFVRSVADFMAGGRNAGRFLICTARSEQGAGAVVFVAVFQMFAISGFTLSWWGQLSVPVSLLIAISGFVIYRYRQTRALTLGQFFEMRYSRNFRLFAGSLAFFAGLINFGVIPVIGARFMTNFLGLPHTVLVLGWQAQTHLLLMAIFLTICVLMTTFGGQIAVLLTDCAEGMFTQIFYSVIAVALVIFFFSWTETRAVLLDTAPGKSLVNPFDSFSLKDFNIWYVMMGLFVGVYSTMAWQNSHAFNASGATPHEARMGMILGRWRSFAGGVMITLLSVCALTYLHSSVGNAAVQSELSKITDACTADQMRIPVALSHMLPIGLKGMLLSICLMGIIAGDGIHLHSWSSIFIQDVVVPMRKKPFTLKQHLLLLRLSILGVAVFAFIFGAIFPQTEYVAIWFAVTQAVFTGGAGAAIIGGLYWKRGTAAGAWVGFLTGSVLSVGGIVTRIYFQRVLGHEFILNGMQIGFIASLAAVVAYVFVSLLTCRKPHNMDQLLHRGAYAVEPESDSAELIRPKISWFNRLWGIDDQFSRSDRWITLGIFWWSITWFVVFVIGSIAYLIHPWSSEVWANFWFVQAICMPLGIGVVTTVWFTIGCIRDLRVFFRRLHEEKIDLHDDGVVEHADSAQLK